MSPSPKHAKGSWVVMNANHGGRLECLRCGAHKAVPFPINLSALGSFGAAFDKRHRKCAPHDEGDVCAVCSGRGHAESDCPKTVPDSARAWLRGPFTGMSSLTIYGVLAPDAYVLHRGEGCTPEDPGDFGRCHGLLRAAPNWRARLGEVAERFPAWTPLVAAWDELSALYEEERQTFQFAKLRARMRLLDSDGRRGA